MDSTWLQVLTIRTIHLYQSDINYYEDLRDQLPCMKTSAVISAGYAAVGPRLSLLDFRSPLAPGNNPSA
jgi:hypothetical protein